MRIQVLPKELIDRIAAGEVVERPASILKELVENALDAEASSIDVTVDADAADYLEVSDNGTGMTREELSVALQRHATSKIRSEQDLCNIRTLGFRGEALPSIAAVSDLEVETRIKDSPYGIRVSYEAGVEKSAQEAGMTSGTRIVVKNLFRHTPARRKFLRSRQTEMGHVVDLFVRLALSRTDVAFQLRKRRGDLWLNAPATEDLRQRAAQLLGWELAERLCPVQEEQDTIRIHGLVGPPDLHKATSQGIFLFLNSRTIRDLGIQRTLRAAYEGGMAKDRFPVAILFLSMPHADVDVNVHPTKQEVRFSQPVRVRDAVRRALSSLLRQAPWQGRSVAASSWTAGTASAGRPLPLSGRQSQDGSPGQDRNLERSVPRSICGQRAYGTESPVEALPSPLIRDRVVDEPGPWEEASLWQETSQGVAGLRLIGQLKDTYLLCESPQGLILVDQHAAHEKLAYEKLEGTFQRDGILQQPLLAPILVELPPQQAESLRENIENLSACGMEVEFFGGSSFVVKSLPALLSGASPADLLRDIAEDLLLMEDSRRLEELRKYVFSRMACHSVIRAGRGLERPEMEALLRELESRPDLSTCPHGRPVRILFSHREIQKRFHRT